MQADLEPVFRPVAAFKCSGGGTQNSQLALYWLGTFLGKLSVVFVGLPSFAML